MIAPTSCLSVERKLLGREPDPQEARDVTHYLFYPPYLRFLRLKEKVRAYSPGMPAIEVMQPWLEWRLNIRDEPGLTWAELLLDVPTYRELVIDLVMSAPLRQAELQARILTGQKRNRIGYAMGLPKAVVTGYETLFFSVRNFLWHEMWIRNVVLQSDGNVSLLYDVPRLWRLAGFEMGLGAVEALVTRVDHDVLLRDGVKAYLDPEVRIPLHLKHWVFERASGLSPAILTPELAKHLPELAAALAAKELAVGEAPDLYSYCTPDGLPLITDDCAIAMARKLLQEAR